MRTRPLLAIGVLVAGGYTTAAHASARGAVVHIDATVHGQEPVISDNDPTLCGKSGGNYDPHGFPTVYTGTLEFKGSFSGRGAFCGWIPPRPNPDGTLNYYETDRLIDGTVDGCGTGSVSLLVHGIITRDYDSGHNAIITTETWKVAEGSGERDLTDIVSGGGSNPDAYLELTPQLNPTLDDVSRDTAVETTVDGGYHGTVRCTRVR